VVKSRILTSVDDGEKRALQMLADYQSADTEQALARKEQSSQPRSNATDSKSDYELAKQWWEQGARQDWENRSFNYADLSGSIMARANLNHSKLLGANLTSAQLQGAFLHEAQLQGANLTSVQLQTANLEGGRFQGASLENAQLQGAFLTGAQLQGVNLFVAKLQGAGLPSAQLQGANLDGAQLQGATCKNFKMNFGRNDKFLLSLIQQPSSLAACIESGSFVALNQADISSIMNHLPVETTQSVRLELQNILQDRIDRPSDLQNAVCGTLTTEMVKIIQLHWNDFVPLDITHKWEKQGQPCSALTQPKTGIRQIQRHGTSRKTKPINH